MVWREACNQLSSWRTQQAVIDEAWAEILNRDSLYRQDLLPGLQNVIVFDTFNQSDRSCQLEPFMAFSNRLSKALLSRCGCVSFKTGRLDDDQASIAQCFDVLRSGGSVFL